MRKKKPVESGAHAPSAEASASRETPPAIPSPTALSDVGKMAGFLEDDDKIAGYLEVGVNDRGEVVVNYFAMTPDANGDGHIVFSPKQARNLARILVKQAHEAGLAKARGETDAG